MNEIGHLIWDLKYRLKDANGKPLEASPIDTDNRIATALANVENIPFDHLDDFMYALSGRKFLPAGRITAGAGTGRDVTLFNCYVMGKIPDSMSGIFSMLKEAALTMQQGGGIGYDFSTIRPKGSEVVKVGADASGPLSFMDVWDAMCRTVMSAGSRRGAMMATMRCDHPDIFDFIDAKKDAAKLRMFNLSVQITDDFMAAVRENGDWDLVHSVPRRASEWAEGKKKSGVKFLYKTIKARDLWNRIMRNTYDFAEPGVIFIDRINQTNNLRDIEMITATNPCGEQPLPPYGACLLGSLNLAAMIKNAFTDKAMLDVKVMARVIEHSIRMLDNAIDASKFPLPQQEAEAYNKRRIGLGITGLADALMMLGIVYGSEEAKTWLDNVMRFIAQESYLASVALAKEKGPFSRFDADEYLAAGTFASTLPERIKKKIRKHGIRNSHLLSIAPTGTISLYAGNVSSGIEPVFRAEFDRKVLQPDGTHHILHVEDYAVSLWRQGEGNDGVPREGLPPTFVDASTLTPHQHLLMQATAQRWVDTSISKTINLPKEIPFDEFEGIYWEAFDSGCKGCTTYRPNDVTGSILIEKEEPKLDVINASFVGGPIDRPEDLEGHTYKIKFGAMEHALYVTINSYQGQPFEIFFNSKDVAHQAWMAALSRMTSAVFRRGGDVSFVCEELQAIHDPVGGGFMNGRHVPSIQAAIGNTIQRHINGDVSGPGEPVVLDQAAFQNFLTGPVCPKCQQHTLIKAEGCEQCTNCEYNKCG